MGVRRVVSSGNPYHDPRNGRFTNKPGAGASGGGVARRLAAAGDYRTAQGTRRDGNTVSRTRSSTASASVQRSGVRSDERGFVRGNVVRNVTSDEAALGKPRASGGRGAATSRVGNRRSLAGNTVLPNADYKKARIGKTYTDNQQNMLQTARRAGREGEKGERLSASEWARKSREATNRQRDDYEADEKARSESRKLLEMAQQQTNMRARAAEFADRDAERRRERKASIAAKKSDIEEIRGGSDPYRDAVNARAKAAYEQANEINPGLMSKPKKDGVRTPESRKADAQNPVARKSMAEQEAEREARFQARRKTARYDNGPLGGVKQNDAKESELSKIAKASAGKIVFGHIG